MRVSLRPDPSKGVFETMLVLDGYAVELDAHLERLAASVEALYGRDLPARTGGTVAEAATSVRHGKLRITVVRGGDGWLRSRIATAEVDPAEVFPAPGQSASLRSLLVENGLGAHKWADRRLLERAAAQNPPRELPLLLDGDGTVLEVSRASVFLARADSIATPPLDGRILPSIARRQALEVAQAEGLVTCEEQLTLDDLLRGDEVFLSGSVRGIEPVGSIDGAALTPGGKVSARIAAGLRRRWFAAPQAEPAAAVAGARPAGRPAH